MSTHSFKELVVWQKSMELVTMVYSLTRQLPETEKYALSDQLKRCSISIPSNIAEGQKRASIPELRHYCSMALGSTAELETQLLIIDRVYYIDISDELNLCHDVARLLTGLYRSLNHQQRQSKN